jgi:AraC-like DNA-binding protein
MTQRLGSLTDRPETTSSGGERRSAFDPADPWPSTDPLGQALRFVRMTGAFYCRSELSEPWGLTLPALPEHLWFHAPLSGSCWLEADDAEPIRLEPGDFALVPHGEGHQLRSRQGAPAPPILELARDAVTGRYEILRHGGGGTAAVLICGAVRLGDAAAPYLRRALPRILRVGADTAAPVDRLHALLQLLANEAEECRPGGETVVERIADALVILAIRWWMEDDPAGRVGWLGALRDREIGHSLSLMHRHPERPWTVASLARGVAMSRSAFALRFNALVGEPPIRYLLRWRMNLALTALQEEGLSVRQVAHRSGYTSEAAFARAFKRVSGVPPGAVRGRQNHAGLDRVPDVQYDAPRERVFQVRAAPATAGR